jgi:hypothetical protein
MAEPTKAAIDERRRREGVVLDALLNAQRRDDMRAAYARIANANSGFDPATVRGLIDMPSDPNEYQFGDVGAEMGNESLQMAKDVFFGPGDISRSMFPESVQPYIGSTASGAMDLGLAGLLGLMGAAEKGVGYGSEIASPVISVPADAIMRQFGSKWPYDAETSAQKLANDVMGMIDAAGAAPEGRMMSAIAPAVKAAMVARGSNALNTALRRAPTITADMLPSAVTDPIDKIIRASRRNK